VPLPTLTQAVLGGSRGRPGYHNRDLSGRTCSTVGAYARDRDRPARAARRPSVPPLPSSPSRPAPAGCLSWTTRRQVLRLRWLRRTVHMKRA